MHVVDVGGIARSSVPGAGKLTGRHAQRLVQRGQYAVVEDQWLPLAILSLTSEREPLRKVRTADTRQRESGVRTGKVVLPARLRATDELLDTIARIERERQIPMASAIACAGTPHHDQRESRSYG